MKNYKTDYLLGLADNALILAQRNSEWCGHGPVLEQDIAITNISLDLIGQARNFYQYAAANINIANNESATEDSLAYLRDVTEFRNSLLVELPKGDWAVTILRQFLFSNYQTLLLQQLQKSNDAQIAAIAAKSLKEATYHLRWSSEWVIRLGDGTEESHIRMNAAIEDLWPYTGELFLMVPYELQAFEAGLGVDVSTLQNEWLHKTAAVFEEATLKIPEKVFMQSGGKTGRHTEHLGYILAELQFMQRAYPNSEW